MEFSAAFVDEWVRSGVRHAVIAPGSRSSALALALLTDARIDVSMRLDERSAAFFALGIALSTMTPVVMLTTSGTAAAEVHAAVIESDLAQVPLIIATADRPVELHDVHAPQTVRQSNLFANALRYFLDLAVPSEETRPYWRSFASRLVAEATKGAKGAGPVQVNIAFREPIVGTVESVPEGRPDGAPWHEVIRDDESITPPPQRIVDLFDSKQRGVLIVGGAQLADPAPIVEYAERRAWPIIGDARAIRRTPNRVLIGHADQFLRSPGVTEALRPELIVHVGTPHASKTLMGWNERWSDESVIHVFVDQTGGFADPERVGAIFATVAPGRLFRSLLASDARSDDAPSEWLEKWRRCDDAVDREIEKALERMPRSEPAVARALFRALNASDTLFCSSSMPVRDIEWFAGPQTGAPRVLANRGANGIDGVVSSVLGAAKTSSGRTVGFVGDLAFLHDLSGLVWGRNEEVPSATFVVIDNQGGGIFSFLDYPSAVEPATFERGFGTPQGSSIAQVARALGCHVQSIEDPGALSGALERSALVSGISIVIVATDRDENVEVHRELARASIEAATSVL